MFIANVYMCPYFGSLLPSLVVTWCHGKCYPGECQIPTEQCPGLCHHQPPGQQPIVLPGVRCTGVHCLVPVQCAVYSAVSGHSQPWGTGSGRHPATHSHMMPDSHLSNTGHTVSLPLHFTIRLSTVFSTITSLSFPLNFCLNLISQRPVNIRIVTSLDRVRNQRASHWLFHYSDYNLNNYKEIDILNYICCCM